MTVTIAGGGAEMDAVSHRVVLAILLAASAMPCTAAPPVGFGGTDPACTPRLFIVNHGANGGSGSLASMCAATPWAAQGDLATLPPSSGAFPRNHIVRVFGDSVYVVSPDAGAIHVFDAATAEPTSEFNLGSDSQPQDIAVVDSQTAYVTRHNATHLLRLNLQTGATTEVADLSVFANGEAPGMSMMAHDLATNRLFIQIQETSTIAVFDVSAEQLIDADPNTPGIQPIVLQGLLPAHKMQIDPALRRLYVSAAGGYWGFTGGIEMIDLDALQSLGFALETKDFGVPEVSGFIMVSSNRGYVIFHTDIAPSSHLLPFTIDGGPEWGAIIDVLGWPVTTSLEFDPISGHVFMPHGGYQTSHPSTPGMFVIEAQAGDLLASLLDVGGWPADLVLVQRCPSDVNGDGVVDIFDLLAVLAKWGAAESFDPADINQNGVVDIFDLLEVLAHWGACP